MFSTHHPFPPPSLPAAQDSPKPKPPVVRGARACKVCRQAKMKCVGGEEGVRQCQRCKKSGAECIFEKHRRGRKPGAKLSEASRVLRNLEKGLSDVKDKVGLPCPPDLPSALQDSHHIHQRFADDLHLPPLKIPPDFDSPALLPDHRIPLDVDQDDKKSEPDSMYPANLIRREGERHSSFFKTILNPEPEAPSLRLKEEPRPSSSLPPASALLALSPSMSAAPDLKDPIEAGIILDENQADTLFQLLFLRLNPFINLFDPKLHTVPYVRRQCRFLFSVLIMACCKFFKPDLYPQVRKIANDFAVRAFSEGWKSVEVAQAFACMTYWKEPEDTRTWTYIGYACRMAVELGLNTFVRRRPIEENELQLLERRNRERTYLVLFVHDRSLSIQTGRLWMLPEDEFIRHSMTWHSDTPMAVRPEDTIIAAMTQLQRIASETTETFNLQKENPTAEADANLEALLRSCNGRLTQWMDTWHHEIRRAGGEKFHMAFLNLFRLHVRLFLNSFGFQHAMATSSPVYNLNTQALSACYNSAIEILQIVVDDFASAGMLRHSQESVTVMTAYAAVFLFKLLRSTTSQLHEGAADEIYTHIGRVAEAYDRISQLSEVMTSAAHHARFLRGLLEHDRARSRQLEFQKRQQQQASSAEYYRRSDPYHYSHAQSSSTTRLPPVQVALSSAFASQEYAPSPINYSPKVSNPGTGTGSSYVASTGYPSPSPSQGQTDTNNNTNMRDSYPPSLPPPQSSSAIHLPPPPQSPYANERYPGTGSRYAHDVGAQGRGGYIYANSGGSYGGYSHASGSAYGA